MLHFLTDWWKFIQIHQYYSMALTPYFSSELDDASVVVVVIRFDKVYCLQETLAWKNISPVTENIKKQIQLQCPSEKHYQLMEQQSKLPMENSLNFNKIYAF